MVVHDVKALVYKMLPKTLALADATQVAHLDWFDSELPLTEDQQDELPQGRFRIVWGDQPFADREGGAQKPIPGYPSFTETVAYPPAAPLGPNDPIILARPDIVKDSLALTATVSGSVVTLTPGVDFEEVNISSYYPESLNGFRILPTAVQVPDDGTDITATYRHIMYDIVRISKRMADLRLMLHATDIEDPANIPAPRLAQPDMTDPIKGHNLVDQMGQSLVSYLMLKRGDALDEVMSGRTPEISLGVPRPVGFIANVLEGTRFRYEVTVGLTVYARDLVETVPRIARSDITYASTA